jgi:hypothetical protein
MLKKVEMLDYDAPTAYSPPAVTAVINTDEIVSVKPTDARGVGPFVFIKFKDGTSMTVRGNIEDFL